MCVCVCVCAPYLGMRVKDCEYVHRGPRHGAFSFAQVFSESLVKVQC